MVDMKILFKQIEMLVRVSGYLVLSRWCESNQCMGKLMLGLVKN